MLKAALLDGDGTMYDTEPLYYKANQRALSPYRRLGKRDYAERWILQKTGLGGFVRDHRLDVDLAELRKARDAYFEQLLEMHGCLMPHAVELLDRLSPYPIGLVTSSTAEEVGVRMKKFKVAGRFRVVVAGDMAEHQKPHKEPYQKGVRLLGVPADAVLAVEDNPSGIVSAKAAGCRTVAYPNGFTKGMDFSMAGRMVSSLAEITDEFLEELFAPPQA